MRGEVDQAFMEQADFLKEPILAHRGIDDFEPIAGIPSFEHRL